MSRATNRLKAKIRRILAQAMHTETELTCELACLRTNTERLVRELLEARLLIQEQREQLVSVTRELRDALKSELTRLTGEPA